MGKMMDKRIKSCYTCKHADGQKCTKPGAICSADFECWENKYIPKQKEKKYRPTVQYFAGWKCWAVEVARIKTRAEAREMRKRIMEVLKRG